MIWFHKVLKLIFQMQPSFPRNICTENWRKLPNFTVFLEIFLYLKNNDSVEHAQKVLLIELFIYFQGKIKFSHCFWSMWLFWTFILTEFLKWNCYFSACKRKIANFFMPFLKAHVSFLSIFESIFSAIKHNSSILFLAQTLYTLVKSSPLKCKFSRFLSARVKIRQFFHVNFELTSQFLFNFCIILHCHHTKLPRKF